MRTPLLLVLAHPALHRSRANAALARAVDSVEGVRVHDLYEAYPDYFIDVAHEQSLLRECCGIVFQHPLYWYSAPALLKEWYDLVLTHGFAYGLGGDALRGKPWLTAITAGGREDAYGAEGYNRFAAPDLLRPIEATAGLCGCDWREPFVLHAGHLISQDELDAQAQAYRRRIEKLRDELDMP